jgi:2-oxoglutarate ferredoxin oxidoreductase subunit beta
MTVICVNNFNYGMTGGQAGATTPVGGITTTSPYGNYEYPFNVSSLAAASGAVYVARWTVLHARRLERAMAEALLKPGFSLVEAIAPCPTGFGRRHKQREGLDTMRQYHEQGVIRHGADLNDTDIGLSGVLVEGKFVDAEKPTFLEQRARRLEQVLGSQE